MLAAGVAALALALAAGCAPAAPGSAVGSTASGAAAGLPQSAPVQSSTPPAQSKAEPVKEPRLLYEEPVPDYVKNAEPWQRAYYEIAYNSGGDTTLYWPKEGPPYMAVERYVYPSRDWAHELWGMEEGQPVLLYTSPGKIERLNTDTLEAVILRHEPVPNQDSAYTAVYYYFNGETAVRLSQEEKGTLLKSAVQEDGQRVFPFQLGVGLGPTSTVARTDDEVRQMLHYLIFDLYQPAVPQGAPDWVGSYMRYLYLEYFTDIDPDVPLYIGMFDDSGHEGFFPPAPLTLIPLPGYNQPPIMYHINFSLGNNLRLSSPCYSFYTYAVGDGLLQKSGSIPIDAGHHVYTDAAGQFIYSAHDYSGRDWAKMTPEGMVGLFSEHLHLGRTYSDPELMRTYCDGLYYPGDEEDDSETKRQWLDEQRALALKKYGVGTLGPCVGNTIELPTETTWRELEKLLIDFMCECAIKYGQWGA